MSSSEHIHQVMTDIGPRLDLRSVVELGNQERWILEVDEGREILADYVPDDDRLFLTAEAGIPSPDARARCYEMLLLFNGKWAETGGLRMALDEDDCAVLQICDVAGRAVTVETLEVLLENFVRALADWIVIVAAEPADEQPAPVDGDAMRV